QHPVQRAVDVDVLGHVVTDEAEAGMARQVADVVGRAGDEVVHAEHLRALAEQELAQVGADEAGAARHEDPHGPTRGSSGRDQEDETGRRPIEWYSKPSRRIRSGSQMLRPSNTTGRRMSARTRSRFRNLNSFHSVTSASPSAPAAAS